MRQPLRSLFSKVTQSYGLKLSLITLSWVPVVMTFNDDICYVARVDGSSMRPTLNANESASSTDWVLLWKFHSRKAQCLHRDDVVLFKSPLDPSKTYCKRIKGIQYDSVTTRHPYPREVVHVPRNHIWVEGDNVFHSVDSNNFGPISNGLVLGRAVTVIWPPSRWGADLKATTGRHDVLTARSE